MHEKCQKHPGKGQPTSDCVTCWSKWLAIDIETAHIAEVLKKFKAAVIREATTR